MKQILRLGFGKEVDGLRILLTLRFLAFVETKHMLAQTTTNHVVDSDKSSTTDK